MKEKLKYIPPVVTKTNLYEYPILDYAKDIKDIHENPKLPQEKVKKFAKKHVPIYQYEPKLWKLRRVRIDLDYDVKGLKNGKFKGLKSFYEQCLGIPDYKIKNAPNANYYEFGLKGQNDGVFMVKNWRKELGTENVGTTKQDFMDSYRKVLENKHEFIDLEGGKKEKMKIKTDDFVDVEKGETKKNKKIKIEPVVEKPEKIKIKKSKADEQYKKIDDLMGDILKDVDEIQKKEEEKEAKKSKRKESIEKTKPIIEKVLEDQLEKQGIPKEKRITPLEIEDKLESYLEYHYDKIKGGKVHKEATLKDLEDITTQINKIMDMKGSEALNRTLNEETKKHFKETILPILQNLDISEKDLLSNFFNKKTSKVFSYNNLETLKKAIIKFQSKIRKESEKPNIIEEEEEDIKEDKK